MIFKQPAGLQYIESYTKQTTMMNTYREKWRTQLSWSYHKWSDVSLRVYHENME